MDIPTELQRQPLRVIIDGQHRISADASIFSKAGDMLIAGRSVPTSPIQRNAKLGAIEYWQGESDNRTDLRALLLHLGSLGCNEVLVESGARLAGAFVAAGLVDELVVYCAPTILGSEARPLLSLPLREMHQQIRWQWQDVRMTGNDLRLTLTPDRSSSQERG